MALDAETVALAYRLFLGREGSAAEIERMRQNLPDAAALRRTFMNAAEFQGAMTRLRDRPLDMLPGLGPLDAPRLIYLHIPKCGGLTLRHLLTDWWGAGAVHSEQFNGLYHYSAANLASKQVFSGHFDFYSTQLVPGRPKLISFLRDPRERLVSLYNFFRAHRPEFARHSKDVLWAQSYDIDEYFANEAVRSDASVNNTVARYFSDVPQIPHRWAGTAAAQKLPIEVMAGQAIANLQRFDFIGFLDRYEASVARLAALLGRPDRGKVEKRNVLQEMMDSNPSIRRIDKQVPSPQTLAEMDALVTHDQRIFDAARAQFDPGAAAAAEAEAS